MTKNSPSDAENQHTDEDSRKKESSPSATAVLCEICRGKCHTLLCIVAGMKSGTVNYNDKLAKLAFSPFPLRQTDGATAAACFHKQEGRKEWRWSRFAHPVSHIMLRAKETTF